MSALEIPLVGSTNQKLAIAFTDVGYILRFLYCDTQDENACWIMDINDADGNPINCGVPLVTGLDLLDQFRYLQIGVAIFCFTDGDIDAIPNFANLGSTSHLFYQPISEIA